MGSGATGAGVIIGTGAGVVGGGATGAGVGNGGSGSQSLNLQIQSHHSNLLLSLLVFLGTTPPFLNPPATVLSAAETMLFVEDPSLFSAGILPLSASSAANTPGPAAGDFMP